MVEPGRVDDETNESILRDRSFQLTLLVSTVAALGASLVSPILDSLVGPFSVSPDRIGLIISALFAPAIVLNPLSGVLIDRYGRKPILIIGLTLFGLGGSMVAVTTNFRLVLTLRFIQGVGYSGTIPVVVTLISDLYSEEIHATAQGFRLAASGLSQFVFPIIGSFLVVLSWRAPFLIYAMALPIALLFYLFFEEQDHRDSDRGFGHAGDGETTSLDPTLTVASLLKQREVVALVLAHGLVYVPYIGFLTYNSIVISRGLNGEPVHAGILVALTSLTFAGTATQAGRITGFFANHLSPLILSSLSLGAGLLVFSRSPTIPIATVGVIGLGIGIGVMGPLFRSTLGDIAPRENKGVIMTVNESFVMIAFTFTPVAISLLTNLLTEYVGLVDAIRLVLTIMGVCISALIILLIGLGFPADIRSLTSIR